MHEHFRMSSKYQSEMICSWLLLLLSLGSVVPTDGTFKKANICLQWNLQRDRLTLSCKVYTLIYTVILFDPSGAELGFCLKFPNIHCGSLRSNVGISLNVNTTEIVLTMKGKIDESVNGNWTCRHGKYGDKATVHVYVLKQTDIKGPSITTTKKFPLIVSQATDIICTATATDSIVRLFWDCVDINDTESTVNNCTIYTSRIKYKASFTDNGKICKCTAQINNFIATTSLQLSINEAPVIYMMDRVNCRMSFPVTIICHAGGYLPRYRFAPWIHTFNDKQMRQIYGTLNTAGNSSSLVFDTCQVGDTGTYTCTLKDTEEEEMSWSNTTSLTVADVRMFSLTMVLWILAVISVLIVSIVMTTSIVRNRFSKRNWRQRSSGAVYFGAPQTDHTVNTYDAVGHDYEEVIDLPEQGNVGRSSGINDEIKNEVDVQLNIPVYLNLDLN